MSSPDTPPLPRDGAEGPADAAVPAEPTPLPPHVGALDTPTDPGTPAPRPSTARPTDPAAIVRSTERTVAPLLTAGEAYPVLEHCFLTAERTISCGFRIFDPTTHLHSPEGQAVGETWEDLIAATLERGVDITLVLSDFDPLVGTRLHWGTWRSVRILRRLADAAPPGAGRLQVRAHRHPAQIGVLPRLLLYPMAQAKIAEQAKWLNGMPADRRAEVLEDLPGLAPYLVDKGDRVAPRRFCLPRLFPVTHHQKLAVFDDDRTYVGGLDLDDRRYDDLGHERPADATWHDVQLLARGPVAVDARAHLAEFCDQTEGKTPPGPPGPLLRTLSVQRSSPLASMSPHPALSEIAAALKADIDAAHGLLYMETQFLRDLDMARRLAGAAERDPDLQLLMVLPAAPEEAAFFDDTGLPIRFGEHLQSRCLRIVRRAFGARLFVASPGQTRRRRRRRREKARAVLCEAPIIYVHAKVSIFGSRSAIVSSANLNGRSLRWDTEAGLRLDDPQDVDHLRARCFDHWLAGASDPALHDPATAVAAWRRLAHRNMGLPPEERQGFLLPYDPEPGAEVGIGLPGIPEEMV